MLRLEPIEFILRAIPEGFLFIFAIYVFSKTIVDKRKYVTSSIIYGAILYLIRLLPINYGVHTILALLSLVFLTTIYNKIDVMKTMKSSLITILIQFLIEGINVFIITLIPNIDINNLFDNPITKALVGLPSLILSYLIVYLIYLLNKKRDD